MRWILTMVVLMVASLTATTSHAAEKIKFVLNWVPEPEFGGIYSAQQIGAFHEARARR